MLKLQQATAAFTCLYRSRQSPRKPHCPRLPHENSQGRLGKTPIQHISFILSRDGNGKETGKWISKNIRDIRFCICANSICFHPKRWKLEGNTNMVIRDIRICIRANPIRFYPKGWKLEGNTNMVIRDIRIRIHANPIRFHPQRSQQVTVACTKEYVRHQR